MGSVMSGQGSELDHGNESRPSFLAEGMAFIAPFVENDFLGDIRKLVSSSDSAVGKQEKDGDDDDDDDDVGKPIMYHQTACLAVVDSAAYAILNDDFLEFFDRNPGMLLKMLNN